MEGGQEESSTYEFPLCSLLGTISPEAQEDDKHPATAAQPLPLLAWLHHPTHAGGFCDVGLHPLLA